MTCGREPKDLGAYVLGALDDAEAAEVRAHLARCPECARVAEEYGATVALLPLVPDEAYVPTEEGAAGLRRVLARVAEERRGARRRRVLLGLVAAAAVAVIAGLGGAAVNRAVTAPPPPTAVVSGRNPVTGVAASVGVTQRGWGSALHLELAGVPGGQRCRLVAEGADGQREVAATWAVPAAGYAGGGLRVDGAVGLQPDRIRRFVVETTDGGELVSVRD